MTYVFVLTTQKAMVYINAEDVEESIFELRRKGFLGRIASVTQVVEDDTYQRISSAKD
jgi:hypothetical protein